MTQRIESSTKVGSGKRQMEIIGWDKFLVEVPPGQWRAVNDLFRQVDANGGMVRLSALLLHCPQCQEQQFFDPQSGDFQLRTHAYVNDQSKPNTTIFTPENLHTLLRWRCRTELLGKFRTVELLKLSGGVGSRRRRERGSGARSGGGRGCSKRGSWRCLGGPVGCVGIRSFRVRS